MVDSKKGVTKTPYKIVGDWRQGGKLRRAGWNSEQLAGVFLSTHRAQPDKK